MTGEEVLSVIGSIMGSYGLLYVLTGLCFNRIFGRYLSFNKEYHPDDLVRAEHTIVDQVKGWWTFLCLGVFAFFAAYPLVMALPEGWGSFDEDGAWTSVRDLVQVTGGLFGSIMLADRIEKFAEMTRREKL